MGGHGHSVVNKIVSTLTYYKIKFGEFLSHEVKYKELK